MKKRVGILCLLLAGSLAWGQGAVAPLAGNGTSESPYEIASLGNLYWIYVDDLKWSMHFIQVEDINASSTAAWNDNSGWMPIGNGTTKFTGTYDGNGYTIDELTINRPALNQGFFGHIDYDAQVNNLGLTNIDINVGTGTSSSYAGGLAGRHYGTINNCYTTGSITGRTNIGGICGYSYYGDVLNSYSTVDVIGQYGVGGLAGYHTYSNFTNCHFSGSVTGINQVGGLIGENRSTTSSNQARIEQSYSTGNVTGTGTNIGGLVGKQDGVGALIYLCYSTGNVTGVSYVGGIVGYQINSASISNSYSKGNVTRSSGTDLNVGGFAGYNTGTIRRCYSTGKVYQSAGVIWNVSDSKNKGFVGSNNTNLYDCFWDMGTSLQTAPSGIATGLTTNQMTQQNSFTNFSFPSQWKILNGLLYPYLAWQDDSGTLDELIPIRKMQYDTGVYTSTIDLDNDEVPDVTISFVPPPESEEIELNYKYSDTSRISSVQLFPHPENLSAYYSFTFEDDNILINGQSFELEFPDEPNNIWYRQPEGDWQTVPSYSPAGMGKKVAAASSGYSYTIDATTLTYDEGGSGEIEFAADKGGDLALPISLNNFTGRYNSGAVLLTWHTESETENAAFRIYRDGEMLTELEGAGTTTEPQSYRWTDNYVVPGRTYRYVLADVDYQGKETKHPEVEVKVQVEEAAGTNFTIGSAYPNPFNPVTVIPLNLAKDAVVTATLYDISGRPVQELQNGALAAGSHDLKISGTDLSTGIYVVHINVNNVLNVRKIALMK